ncbi:MAG: MarC family protein [Deltaproteobacteria bacterium]
MSYASVREVVSFSLVTFTGIFTVVDPLSALPLFVAMTGQDSQQARRAMAKRASFAAALILSAFALAGGLLFKFFGVTLPAFKVAGGLLLLLMAIDMLRAQTSRVRASPEETAEGAAKEDVAIFPLATPLLAGPGSIATTMVFMGRSTAWWQAIPVLAAVLVTCFISYWLLRGAALIDRLLGRTGMNVLNRVMGLILAAIAVQFILDGLSGAFPAMAGISR